MRSASDARLAKSDDSIDGAILGATAVDIFGNLGEILRSGIGELQKLGVAYGILVERKTQ